MKILKSYEDLDKFKKIVPADKFDGGTTRVIYEIKENEKLCDVTFDFAFDFECSRRHNKALSEALDEVDCVDCIVEAKDMTLNYFVRVDSVKVQNLTIKKDCDIDFAEVKDCICGNRILAKNLLCKTVECKDVRISQMLKCKNLKAKLLVFENSVMHNVKADNLKLGLAYPF